jgi:hypothetical protein
MVAYPAPQLAYKRLKRLVVRCQMVARSVVLLGARQGDLAASVARNAEEEVHLRLYRAVAHPSPKWCAMWAQTALRLSGGEAGSAGCSTRLPQACCSTPVGRSAMPRPFLLPFSPMCLEQEMFWEVKLKLSWRVYGRTILNLASRSTSTPFDSPKATISSVVLFVITPPKLNILEPVPVGPSFKVKRTDSPRKGMPR